MGRTTHRAGARLHPRQPDTRRTLSSAVESGANQTRRNEMNTYERAMKNINLRKSDAASNSNIDIVPLMMNWKEAARQLFYKITYSEMVEFGLNISDYVSDDDAFQMFEDNKTVSDYVNFALEKKNEK
jgi:hypothetical protein